MEILAPIFPVIRKYGVTCSPDEFHRLVNLAFHRAESQVYDIVHRCMWQTLPQQFELLVDDYRRAAGWNSNGMITLDIGCGTGLASDLLLRTRLGRSIAEVDLLDTSSEMLEQAKNTARTWNVKTRVIEGSITTLRGENRKYDIITICSVLHHIPDLAAFLSRVRMLQANNGILIHLQDPNGDYLTDPILRQRITELKHFRSNSEGCLLARLHPRRLLRGLTKQLAGMHHRTPSYIDLANKELIQSGVIREPMAPLDMWAVTDLHVHDGHGISLAQMSQFLTDYALVSGRSYAFFGDMSSTLPPHFRHREEQLIRRKALNGLQIAGIWEKRRTS